MITYIRLNIFYGLMLNGQSMCYTRKQWTPVLSFVVMT